MPFDFLRPFGFICRFPPVGLSTTSCLYAVSISEILLRPCASQPRKVTVDVAKCRACHANSRRDNGVNWDPSAPPEPAQCHKCQACHAKCASMSPSATPATQNVGGRRPVPRLPRKQPRRPRRQRMPNEHSRKLFFPRWQHSARSVGAIDGIRMPLVTMKSFQSKVAKTPRIIALEMPCSCSGKNCQCKTWVGQGLCHTPTKKNVAVPKPSSRSSSIFSGKKSHAWSMRIQRGSRCQCRGLSVTLRRIGQRWQGVISRWVRWHQLNHGLTALQYQHRTSE